MNSKKKYIKKKEVKLKKQYKKKKKIYFGILANIENISHSTYNNLFWLKKNLKMKNKYILRKKNILIHINFIFYKFKSAKLFKKIKLLNSKKFRNSKFFNKLKIIYFYIT